MNQRTARARYIVGIDLGTTNTAVAFVDTRAADPRVEVFEVPQLVAPGAVDARRQLPSFVYLAGEHDLAPGETAVPWAPERRYAVGELARAQGARHPSRMIASSKSWLCHAGVDRHAAILPWGVEDVPKLSPVEASARVLEHVREAWDHAHASDRLADQEVIVTVPASFDEAARELTIEAATKAGLPGIVLVEEPQAAFYAWIHTHAARKHLRPGERVLVFDVGGGTTDFTLIEVGAAGPDGEPRLERTAVGDHLLLGGDNIDLTLAKRLEMRLGGDGRKLDPLQWHGLVHACRLAKESLLSNPDVDALPITVTGRGARLIAGTLRADLPRTELEETLFDGFFPIVRQEDLPRRARGGLQEFGLPYAADAGITRHLASFLARHDVARVDAVLFNGGTMAPVSLRRRVLEQIGRWQPEAGEPRELTSRAPELAVAEGAAWFGLARRGLGTRIGGGTARACYVGVGRVDGREMAVCLAGKGLEEGAAVELERDFKLVTNRPVSFKLYSSTSRDDRPGALCPVGDGRPETLEDESDLLELPPIVTVLRAPGRGDVNVRLVVRVTELGALEIWCAEPGVHEAGWRLSFDMRAGGAKVEQDEGAPAASGVLDPRFKETQALLKAIFTETSDRLPRVMKLLEEAVGAGRDEWPTATARALFDAAFEVEEARRRSPDHEARWLNLTGFCLRPGTGAPLDDWRAKQMWRIFNEDLVHTNAEQCRLSWWIAWRRIAGGLSKGQQHQIYLRLAQLFVPSSKGKKRWYELKPSPQEAGEMLRCLANLERLSPDAKIVLGDELLRRLETKKGREEPINLWALARIGARLPLYGPLNAVVPASKVTGWLGTLLPLDWPARAAFPLAQLGRRTGDRARDLDDETRARLAAKVRALDPAGRAALLVEQVVALEAREEHIALGDTLPPGLRLVLDADAGPVVPDEPAEAVTAPPA